MSYSFSVRGSTKSDVLAKVAAALDDVVARQPSHSADRQKAQASVEAFLEILPDGADGKDLRVTVSGSLGWTGTTEADRVLTGASINVSASLFASE